MDFVTTKELRAESGKVWAKLEAGEEIVITRNGKPFALLVHSDPESLETTLRAIRAERFANTVRKMQQHSIELGLDKMTMEEIDAEIALMRKERRERDAGSH
ncbi:MAG: type II toxin-antitoxin system Phd/YefM family antitoxin [Sulfuricella sp.]|nr:type II toxin-antitoxin system Phd/YefM family antitoxin [Sulfuricella sp.]